MELIGGRIDEDSDGKEKAYQKRGQLKPWERSPGKGRAVIFTWSRTRTEEEVESSLSTVKGVNRHS